MKVAIFSFYMLLGVFALALGVSALWGAIAKYSFVAAVLAVLVLSLAGLCLGFCKECMFCKLRDQLKPRDPDMA